MNSKLHILGIAGSIRKQSLNRMTLHAATKLVPGDAVIETFDDLGQIPPFNQDDEANPPGVGLKRRIRAADAILFVTPEYNYSVPGEPRTPSTGLLALAPTAHGAAAGSRHERLWRHLRRSARPICVAPEFRIPEYASRQSAGRHDRKGE
ncbi:MAG TPA: NADPH-dependent FMN reductase [Candidatus Acidoferrum sp.]|jgi:hypothetical protein|nr:NADPH-dependent FMN reductase [Candidatus Acidoferrum sp.]